MRHLRTHVLKMARDMELRTFNNLQRFLGELPKHVQRSLISESLAQDALIPDSSMIGSQPRMHMTAFFEHI